MLIYNISNISLPNYQRRKDKMRKGVFYLLCSILATIIFLTWAVFRLNALFEFQEEIQGYLQNYVEAGTVDVALDNLNKAVQALEEKEMTDGTTGIFREYPNDDVGLWYNNLLKSRNQLIAIENQSEYAKSIILEKQRNGLTGNGTSIELPEGISAFPHNKGYFWWEILSGIATAGLWWIVCHLSEKQFCEFLIQSKKKRITE